MSPATVGVPARVAWLDTVEGDADVVYASTLPDGPPVVMGGTAALIFVVAADGGTLDEVVDRVAEAADLPPADVRPDVVQFVEHLVTLGLLTHD
jgi:hypothetical protein